MFIICRLFSTQ